MRKTTVINTLNLPHELVGEIDIVYIGRPGPLGNPFIIGRDGTREEVIDKHKRWIRGEIKSPDSNYRNPPTKEEIQRLRGKILRCWCKPLACHGDILAEIADSK